jgi:hypothetical protein
MFTRAFILLIVTGSLALAAGNPPSEASVKQLLEVTQVHKLLDSTMSQMDSFMKNAMQQATQGQPVSPQIQKHIDKETSEMMKVMKEELSWEKLEPMYVRVYQQSFNQDEVNGLVALYKTSSGQVLINKMPVVMQNTFTEMQKMMGPLMQRIQRTQQEIVAEIQAEKGKNGPG